MSGIICSECGRDIDEIGQDNMSCTSEPLCEDCWNDQQSYAVNALRRGNKRLRSEVEALEEENEQLKAEIALIQPDAYMKLPVDADSVPIRIGDEMVDICAEKPVVVDGYRCFPAWEKLGFTAKNKPGIYDPSAYWHKKPEPADSWEKLEEDARKTSCDYAPAPLDANGLTTCNGCRFKNGGPCHLEKDIDLIRRAKKLVGIEEGAQR